MREVLARVAVVSDRKDTKLLKAIHNTSWFHGIATAVVSDRKDTKLLKAIHNWLGEELTKEGLLATAKIQNF